MFSSSRLYMHASLMGGRELFYAIQVGLDAVGFCFITL